MSILYEILIASLFTALLAPPSEGCDDSEKKQKIEQVAGEEQNSCETYELS